MSARRRRRTAVRVGLDLLMLALAGAAAAYGASQSHAPSQSIGWTAIYGLLTTATIAARGGYRFRLRVSSLEYVGQVIAATAVAAMFAITIRVIVAPEPDIASEVVRTWGFSAAYLLAARGGIAIVDRHAVRNLNTLIVGAGVVGRTVAHRLAERPEMGLTPIGFLDLEPLPGEGEPPVLGASYDLERVVHAHDVEHVIVTFSTAPHTVLLDLVRRCRALGIEVSVVPRLFEEVSRRVTIEHLGGIALLRVERADPRGWQFEAKYAIDRVLGALLVALTSPLLLLIAIVVKLSSPGPVFFTQKRIGLDGREFDILKFRTMRVIEGAPEHDAVWAAQILDPDLPLPSQHETDADADRRTRAGMLLRRSCLDELPQLLNILRGDMSLVGPRPERTGYSAAFSGRVHRYGDRHRVKSGLTGWAQVQGLRGETSLSERIEWDNYYIENWSPALDLKIVLLTLPAVLRGARRDRAARHDDVGAAAGGTAGQTR